MGARCYILVPVYSARCRGEVRPTLTRTGFMSAGNGVDRSSVSAPQVLTAPPIAAHNTLAAAFECVRSSRVLDCGGIGAGGRADRDRQWATRHVMGAFTISQALGLDAPRSTDGSMNILLIGLVPEKVGTGNDLPERILDRLHAGGYDDGELQHHTLILAHVDTDNRVVRFRSPATTTGTHASPDTTTSRSNRPTGLARPSGSRNSPTRASTIPKRWKGQAEKLAGPLNQRRWARYHAIDYSPSQSSRLLTWSRR